jgi:SulP family sulfate permease
MLLFAPMARFIPRAALAGILLVSAFRMVDWKALRYHLRATRFDQVIVAATALAAVAISVEFCILIGVVLSFLLAVPRAGRMTRTEFIVTREGVVRERLADDPACERMLVFGLEGELFFGSSAALDEHLDSIEERAVGHAKVVVLRAKRLRNPDAVGMHELAKFLDRMEAKGVRVILCGVRRDLRHGLRRSGLAARLGDEQIFLERTTKGSSTVDAIAAAYRYLGDDRCAECPRKGNGAAATLAHFQV